MKKKEEKIPFSNYIKLIFIILITMLCVLGIRKIYLSNVDYENNIPVIRDSIVREINSNEIYNYIRENEDSIIYVGVASDKLCRTYEEVLKEIISKYHLEEDITYLNLTDLKAKKSFIKEFNKFYNSGLKNYPSIIIFNEGKVTGILNINDDKNMKNSTINFLLDNEVVLNEGD